MDLVVQRYLKRKFDISDAYGHINAGSSLKRQAGIGVQKECSWRDIELGRFVRKVDYSGFNNDLGKLYQQ